MPEGRKTPQKIAAKDVRLLELGGAGAGGLVYAGALEALQHIPGFSYDNIDYVCGNSIGAIAALAIALKFPPDRMLEILASIDFTKLKDSGSYAEVLKRFVWDQKHYLYKGNVIYQHVLALLQEATGLPDPAAITFRDLKRLGFKNLHITACEFMNTQPHPTLAARIFSYENSPDMPVALAIKASTAAYPYFNYVKVNGRYYVDGAFKTNVPNIYNYPRYFPGSSNTQDKECPEKCPDELRDAMNRNDCIKNNIVVERKQNPNALVFCVADEAEKEPINHPPTFQEMLTAILNGAMTHDDQTLDAEIDNRVVFKRHLKVTEFDVKEDDQKNIICDGASGIFNYFGLEYTPEHREKLIAKIDDIKARAANAQQQKTAHFKNNKNTLWQGYKKSNTQTAVPRTKMRSGL